MSTKISLTHRFPPNGFNTNNCSMFWLLQRTNLETAIALWSADIVPQRGWCWEWGSWDAAPIMLWNVGSVDWKDLQSSKNLCGIVLHAFEQILKEHEMTLSKSYITQNTQNST